MDLTSQGPPRPARSGMRTAPTSSLPRRLGLFLAERTRVLDAAGATVGGALLAAYGAALAGGAPTPGPLLGAMLAAGLFTGLAFLQTAVLGPDQGASGALARGLVRPAEARGLCVLFAAGQLAALAAVDPPLAAFAPGLWAALLFTTPRRAARGLCVAA
ncbi:MAG: hypothetical protein KJS97_16230, partial [Alphaproteobacteria bacterium]|nr:hypothetical protein [Alphaproteobacteria bacterium]